MQKKDKPIDNAPDIDMNEEEKKIKLTDGGDFDNYRLTEGEEKDPEEN